MMNVGLHHRGVDTQLLAVLQFEVDPPPAPPESLIALSVAGVSRGEARWNAKSWSRHRQTIEFCNWRQGATIGDRFAAIFAMSQS